MKGKISNTGYKKDSKDRNNDFNIIPSNIITMNNVTHPVLGISDSGDTKMMYPEQNYQFKGNSVTEFPIKNKTMTKQEMLKIAKVKDEASFYKKFPTEESFMAKHGKTLKAQLGSNIPPVDGSLQGYPKRPMYFPQPGVANEPMYDPSTQSGLQTYNPNSDINYQIAQNQQVTEDVMPNTNNSQMDFIGNGLPIVGGILGGISAFEAGKQKRKQAEQAKKVSEVALRASTTRPEMRERRYVRPEDNVFATSQMFPANGVGTNVLAKKGAKLKSYQDGGGIFSQFGQNPYGNMAGSFFDNNGGSQIGGAIGSAFGPVGGIAGSLIGGALDTNGRRAKKAQEATQRNVMNMALNNMAPSIQAGYASHLKYGGDISDMEHGGELMTGPQGKAELMSYNPYIDGGGETVMFKGPSHDNGGIPIKYGNSPVEVEGGEPATKINNELTVFGDLKIPNALVSVLGDPSAKGKKFKNYVADLSKKEAKQNNLVSSSMGQIDDLHVLTPFDNLKFNTLQANVLGGNMKLKDIAGKKSNAAALQSAMNSESETRKGMTAQYGKEIPPDQYGLDPWQGNKHGLGEATKSSFTRDQWNQIAQNLGFKGKGNKEFQEFLLTNKDSAPLIKERHSLLYNKDPFVDEKLGYGWSAAGLLGSNKPAPKVETPATADTTTNYSYETVPYRRNKMADYFNMALPFIRPTDQEPLDYHQLMGEMYAMSNNSVEPVQAQTYQPDLGTPYDISYQDQLNANQSDYRSVQRAAGSNPAALAMLNAQKYSANEKVLGEQFRANQGMKDKVYGENRNILNDAKLKNLSIYDQQYTRQSQAVSNTKATTQAALNSIADKYAKNQLENRTLGVYENLYNYRYDDAGRAINFNPLYQPNMPVIYSPDGKVTHVATYDDKGKINGYREVGKGDVKEIPSGATPPLVKQKNGGTTNLNSYFVKNIK